MKVKVYSMFTVRKTEEPEHLISIRNAVWEQFVVDDYADLDKRLIKENFDSSLIVRFDDVLTPDHGDLCTDKQAKEIVAFVKGKENIAIHCSAGMSRSVAVGAFLRDFYQAEVTFTVTGHDNFKNIHVYNLLRREHYGKNFNLLVKNGSIK